MAIVLVAMTYLVVPALRSSARFLALALLAVLAFTLHRVTLLFFESAPTGLSLVALVAVLVVAVSAAKLAAQGLRRLPQVISRG
ncbi:hypothetical protein [Amycolatopsis sp.]|uniref:hypothetical protein n=1 Tax=Amycolatopsis sp. TaxID=37632 RepID=UPI002E09C015|nr:hypothetical protein [Amycolatopsis sp.]